MSKSVTLPVDWSKSTIGECCEVLDSQRVPISSTERAKRKGSVPYYGANGQVGWIDTHIFDDDLVLLAEDGGNFDDYATRPIAYRVSGKSWVNNHAHVLKAIDDVTCTGWIFRCLEHADITRFIRGSTRAKLNKSQLVRIPIPFPDLPEQRRIAEILDTADEAIQKTEALIAKLKQMKAGLLHDLLTRGIDENGELRDSCRSADLFREVDGMSVPRHWEEFTLDDVGDWCAGGTPSKQNTNFWDGDIPWLTPKDMKVFEIKRTTDYLTEQGAKSGTRMVPANSVFIVVRGMILAHTFPVCICSEPYTFNQDIRALVTNKNTNSLFMSYWFLAHEQQLLRITTSATHGTRRIDMADLREVPVFLPPIDEQIEITRRLESLNRRINCEETTRQKLQTLKAGLMHDLLTGKKRVKTLEPVTA